MENIQIFKKENYTILKDTSKYIEDILQLDKEFYKEEYIWNSDYQRKLFNKNKDTFILVGYKEKLIGYLNYLCITKEKYTQMKESKVTVDEFELKDVIKFKKGQNYITINSIIIDKKHQNGEVIKLINDGFLEKLKELEIKGIKICGIDGVAVSEDGQKYFEKLGFTKLKKLDKENYLYVLEENIVSTIEKSILKLKSKKH